MRLAHVKDFERALNGPAAHRAHREPDGALGADAIMTAGHDRALHAHLTCLPMIGTTHASRTQRVFTR